MKLTHENYFSREAMTYYMSYSQFKSFETCEARALAELKGEWIDYKECYKEGHYFEACLDGAKAEEKFLLQNPDMVSSRGPTKGELKSNYSRIKGSVDAFKRQSMFMDIVKRSKPQVIVTGSIAGIEFKGCIDFLDDDMNSNDTKVMKDFKRIYSDADGMYVNWYFAYGYHYQAAIYRELTRQTYGRAGNQNIMAVTKEEEPDVSALTFSREVLDNAFTIIEEFAPKYDRIKRGLEKPESCGHCDYCRTHKTIEEFELVGEYE